MYFLSTVVYDLIFRRLVCRGKWNRTFLKENESGEKWLRPKSHRWDLMITAVHFSLRFTTQQFYNLSVITVKVKHENSSRRGFEISYVVFLNEYTSLCE